MRSDIFFTAVSLAFVSCCQGATLLSSGTFGVGEIAYTSDPSRAQIMAAQFTVSTGVSIGSIRVEGVYENNAPANDHFSIAIMRNNGGGVGTVVGSYVFSNVASTRSFETGTFSLYEYTLTPATTIDLAAGTYWLSIMNDTDTGSWGWAAMEAPGNPWAVSFTSQTGGYTPLASETFVFSFDGAVVVPEPCAVALGGLGLGLGLMGRRRRW